MNLLTVLLKDEEINRIKETFSGLGLQYNLISLKTKKVKEIQKNITDQNPDFIFAALELAETEIQNRTGNIIFVTHTFTEKARELIYKDGKKVVTPDSMCTLAPFIREYCSQAVKVNEKADFNTGSNTDNNIFISLYNILQFTLSAPAGENIYQKIIKEVANITAFPYIFLGIYTDEKHFIFKGVHGLPINPDAEQRETIDENFSGRIIKEKKPFVKYNVLETDSDNKVVRTLGINTIVYLPVFSGSKVTGVLGFAHTDHYVVSDEQFTWLDTLSKYISSLIEKNHNREQLNDQAELLNKTNDAIVVIDTAKKILFWNKGAQKLYNFSENNAVEKKLDNYFLFSKKDTFNEIEKIVYKKGEWSGELKDLTAKGKEIILESRWSLIKDKNDSPARILIVNTDITEKRKFEKQIMQTQRMEGLGTLASGIAHDLNNIFTPIIMCIDELGSLKQGEKIDFDYVRTIKTCAERGSDLVRRILSLTRGNDENLSEIYLSAFVKEFLSIIGKSIPKTIKTSIFIDNKLTFIFNETHLNQIFLNLCLNARDAMPDGGEMTISADKVTFSKHFFSSEIPEFTEYIEICVTDTGMGIPENIKEKIFDPFFTTKGAGKGTGLGLPTVLSILNSYQGFMNVESTIGKGTMFKVYIPLRTSDLLLESVLK